MIKINLAPPTERRRSPGMPGAGIHLGLVFGVLGLLLVGGIAAGWWSLSAHVARLTREIDDEQREVDRLKTVIVEHQRFRRDKEDLERRVNAIEAVAQNQTLPVYLLDAVAGVVPADVYLTRMEEKARQVRFAGVASSTTALSDFMANLNASGKFKDVDLIESRQDLTKTPRAVTFEVSARFEV